MAATEWGRIGELNRGLQEQQPGSTRTPNGHSIDSESAPVSGVRTVSLREELPAGSQPYLLSNSRPTRHQTLFALCISAVLACACLAAVPFARIRLEGTEGLLPAYAAAMLLVEVITAALLLATYSVQRSLAVLVLSSAYLFSGLLALPWALTFPGVFDAFGLDTGMQSTATIAAVRRLGFALLVLAYAVLRNQDGRTEEPPVSSRPILTSVGMVGLCVALLTLAVFLDPGTLPEFMVSTRDVSGLWSYVSATALILYATTLLILLRGRRSVLDLWLIVVIVTLSIEIILLSYVSGGIRLSVGWWAGRVYGLVSASIVLLALLSQTTALHAKLAHAVSQERRIRESRLTMMEALSASIAHEINQPLSSMVTNANAAARWLDKPRPEIDEAQDAIEDIVSDGHRAGTIIEGIRMIFQKSSRDRELLDVKTLVKDVLRRWQADARRTGVALETDLEEEPVTVVGNRIQLQQVISNLVANAIDAVNEATGGERVVQLRTRQHDRNWVQVSVEDTGPGVALDDADRIFEAFFTTKPEGMGMGLMFCRSVIESHGGRLWLERHRPGGAAFRFTLPRLE
ncbi:MAG: GHKL domain-containing protein [Mesorhizobium sp.]|nr:MAG: GHKL domain-containing protein [Mesorhizobium sp.]RWK50241.1 MAG: GHKL domain-containing protein [Mesorhizobium sp.]RWK93634.1 MAG: GHKL domain-containing protein [Mesorhizobium sp.]TIP99106.1 MAG: GHKL domain-containing protein [Mesorhizobium sp.]TIQ28797.1 MAG: GHKL domain-containing protein [Mesorhizobium sp.]